MNGTKKYYAEIKNNVPNGKMSTYKNEGEIISEAYYYRGKQHGVANYYENKELRIQELYLNDELQFIYEYYPSQGFIVKVKVKNDYKTMGFVYYDSIGNIDKEKSRYYNVTASDTIKLGDRLNLNIEVYFENKKDRIFKIQIDDSQKLFGLPNNKTRQEFDFHDMKTDIILNPKQKGYNLLTGIISVYGKNGEKETQFLLHKGFYVK